MWSNATPKTLKIARGHFLTTCQILELFLTSILKTLWGSSMVQKNWPPKTMWLWWILNEINDFIGVEGVPQELQKSVRKTCEMAHFLNWRHSSPQCNFGVRWLVPVTQTFVFQFFEVCIFSDWSLGIAHFDRLF